MADRWMRHVDGSVSAMYYHVHDEHSKRSMESVSFDESGDGKTDGSSSGRHSH